MLDYFIVTLWLEMHGKLYQKLYLPLQTDCAKAKVEIVKEFEKQKDIEFVHMKCEPTESFKITDKNKWRKYGIY